MSKIHTVTADYSPKSKYLPPLFRYAHIFQKRRPLFVSDNRRLEHRNATSSDFTFVEDSAPPVLNYFLLYGKIIMNLEVLSFFYLFSSQSDLCFIFS